LLGLLRLLRLLGGDAQRTERGWHVKLPVIGCSINSVWSASQLQKLIHPIVSPCA
jgi:hypothetical protein